MDPFEARLQFIKTLQRLNASNEANENALQFLLLNPDLMEDLYSCTLEELDKSSLNVRLNILYFLEMIFCECSARSATQFQHWIGRDLDKIVNKVIPETPVGLVNLAPSQSVVSKILSRGKIHVDSRVKDRVQIVLTIRQELLNRPLPENNSAAPISTSRDHYYLQSSTRESSIHTDENNRALTSSPVPLNSSFDLSRTEILRRMDEDRERSKRLKEDIWAIDYQHRGPFCELNSAWETSGPLDDLDFEQMKEDNEIAESSFTAKVTAMPLVTGLRPDQL